MSIRFTDRFSKQLDQQLDYIRARSPSGAEKVSRRVTAALDTLKEQPRSGRATSRRTTRRVNLSPYPYVIFYRVVGDDDILVLRFVHSARKTA